uniref:Uncharacterized protein n=1 Tax=Oncorhynchus mykiss TaxID=8022 RepID=A0A8L0DS66_ONCMY
TAIALHFPLNSHCCGLISLFVSVIRASVVLLNRDVNVIWEQLNHPTFYQKLSRDPTPLFKEEIHLDLIRSVIHALPKIHKRLDKPPGRPIVPSFGSLTENISAFVDFIL